MKVLELDGHLLDYWVGHLEEVAGLKMRRRVCYRQAAFDFSDIEYSPTQDWQTGGPIIERERISLLTVTVNLGSAPPAWAANVIGMPVHAGIGKTFLVAAMRAYVASKMGDTVPDEVPA